MMEEQKHQVNKHLDLKMETFTLLFYFLTWNSVLFPKCVGLWGYLP